MPTSDPGTSKPLRLEAFVTAGMRPISRPRLLDPVRAAGQRAGIAVAEHVDSMRISRDDSTDRVLIRYRPVGSARSWGLHRAALKAGYLVISDLDDLLWEPGSSNERGEEEERLQGYRESDHVALRGVHAIQASTPALAEAIRRFNPTVRVFPPTISEIPAFQAKPDRPPRILFAALNRTADWQPILGPLNHVLRQRPDVFVATLHDEAFHAALATDNKRHLPFQPYPRYLDALDQSDIALLPLAETRFNRCKSDLKFVECAARGTAVLASAVSYGDSIKDGVTGLLYRTPEEFGSKLKRLLKEPGLGHALARAAYDWVIRHRDFESAVDARLGWYRDLLADKAALDKGIRQRAGWILDPTGRPPECS